MLSSCVSRFFLERGLISTADISFGHVCADLETWDRCCGYQLGRVCPALEKLK